MTGRRLSLRVLGEDKAISLAALAGAEGAAPLKCLPRERRSARLGASIRAPIHYRARSGLGTAVGEDLSKSQAERLWNPDANLVLYWSYLTKPPVFPMPDLLDPKNDYVFKRLFAEAPDLLVALINDLRPDLPDITAV